MRLRFFSKFSYFYLYSLIKIILSRYVLARIKFYRKISSGGIHIPLFVFSGNNFLRLRETIDSRFKVLSWHVYTGSQRLPNGPLTQPP